MSGHSKFNNIKHRKAKQDSAEAREFLKLSERLRYLISQKKIDLPEALSLARKQGFTKEKVLKIWKTVNEQSEEDKIFCKLYQAPFEVIVYIEVKKIDLANWERENQLKEIEKTRLSNYFYKLNEWKIKEKQFNLEEHLLNSLPSEFINQIEEIKYKDGEIKIIFAEQISEIIKKLFIDHEIKKDIIWKPSFVLVSQEALDYVKKLIESIKDKDDFKLYFNVE